MSKDGSSLEKTYSLQARYYPAVLTVFPILFLLDIIRREMVFPAEGLLIFMPYLVQIGVSGAFFCFQIQLNRLISKEIFQKLIFKNEMNMPTTINLLWNDNTIDSSIKQVLHIKIKSMFDISLLPREEEEKDNDKAKKLIIFAVSQIRNSLRGNAQQVQHNREYSFWRNFAGGSVFAVCVSIIILVFGLIKTDYLSIIVGIGMLCFYGSIIGLSPYFIRRSGQYYAKSLFEQFLSIK
jgi:hypothetical protein